MGSSLCGDRCARSGMRSAGQGGWRSDTAHEPGPRTPRARQANTVDVWCGDRDEAPPQTWTCMHCRTGGVHSVRYCCEIAQAPRVRDVVVRDARGRDTYEVLHLAASASPARSGLREVVRAEPRRARSGADGFGSSARTHRIMHRIRYSSCSDSRHPISITPSHASLHVHSHTAHSHTRMASSFLRCGRPAGLGAPGEHRCAPSAAPVLLRSVALLSRVLASSGVHVG